MKLHSLFFNIFLFVLVLIFLICPSLISVFTTSVEYSNFTQWNFPCQQGILFFVAIGLFLISKNLDPKKQRKSISTSVYFVFYIITPFIFTFLLLFCNSLIFSFLSTLNIFGKTVNITVNIPDSFITWIYCILNFLFAAFFEEVIYRYYFIDELNILLNKSNRKSLLWIFEVAGLLVFAISHYYLGILSVFNAAIAHIILRICYKKSGNIFPGFFAHFCYNIISLILL